MKLNIDRIAKVDLRFYYILRETEISVAYKVKKKSIRANDRLKLSKFKNATTLLYDCLDFMPYVNINSPKPLLILQSTDQPPPCLCNEQMSISTHQVVQEYPYPTMV